MMQELSNAEIDEIAGSKSLFYWVGYGLGQMAANFGTVDMSGAMACGA